MPSQFTGHFLFLPSLDNWQARQETENDARMGEGPSREKLAVVGEIPGWPAISMWGDLAKFMEQLRLMQVYRDTMETPKDLLNTLTKEVARQKGGVGGGAKVSDLLQLLHGLCYAL